MRIFVYEYTCAAAAEPSAAAASLRAEGAAMLTAILEDFQRVPGVEAFTLRGTRFQSCPNAKTRLESCPTIEAPEEAFRTAARQADYSLIIAPEFDGILLKRCRWVLEEGGRLLGPSPEAVALTSDKFGLFQWWQAHGVPTPETVLMELAAQASAPLAFAAGSVICKQRDGAGCSFARIVTEADWPDIERQLFTQAELPALVVQPFVVGQAASVAFLVGPKHCLALPAAAQHLEVRDQLKYLGGEVPLAPPLAERAERIARRAISSLPGLLGYVGVDIVLGDDGRDWVIEINPRLTTSYVGLRALAEFNLAEAMLAVVQGREPPERKWREGRIRFGTDGTCKNASG
jgi:tyramine---L-glutamate ligase